MDIIETTMNILKDISGKETIERSDSLQEDIGIDSLSMVSLLIELEDTFQFELQESDMNPFDLTTVADVIALVEKYCSAGHEEREI